MRGADPIEDLRDLRLSLLWSVSPRHLRAIRAMVLEHRLAFPWGPEDLLALPLSEGLKRELALLPGPEQARSVLGRMRELGIAFQVEGEPGYPSELTALHDPPSFLFVRGDPLESRRTPRVGIVGSRAASLAGLETAYDLARDLALAGCAVVSGLARGIDGEAHRGALDAGGQTIAVLGTGADRCYPPEHGELFDRILNRGTLVTEFPPGTPGLPLHFPRRNRILAALSDVLVVVEGGERSGARSTVDHALDIGLEVLAVPRDLQHPGSRLPNRLLADGARPVLSSRDILEALATLEGFQAAPASIPLFSEAAQPARVAAAALAERTGPRPPTVEERLLEALRWRRLDLETCARLVPEADAGQLLASLLRLEVDGWISRLPGGVYQTRRSIRGCRR